MNIHPAVDGHQPRHGAPFQERAGQCAPCVAWKDECEAVCKAVTCVTLSLEEVANATKLELQEVPSQGSG